MTSTAPASETAEANKFFRRLQRCRLFGCGQTQIESRLRSDRHVAMRSGKLPALPETPLGKVLGALALSRARIRAKVEHPFHFAKKLLKYKKTDYLGITKNAMQLLTLLRFG